MSRYRVLLSSLQIAKPNLDPLIIVSRSPLLLEVLVGPECLLLPTVLTKTREDARPPSTDVNTSAFTWKHILITR